MPYDLSVYTREFFEQNRAEGLRHAEWFVPLLIAFYNPSDVLDVGCGTGHFIEEFTSRGISAWGIEGASAALTDLARDPDRIIEADLRSGARTYWRTKRYDLAISIEVAEHIEKEYADQFVKTLTDASDRIVMTAATPGQGGPQHVNEQPPEYWAEKFANVGYVADLPKLALLLDGIHDARDAGLHVAPWWSNISAYRRAE